MPTFRFERVFHMARGIKIFFSLNGGIVRGKVPVGEQVANQGMKSKKFRQRKRLLRRSIKDKRQEIEDLENEIRSKKNLAERYGPRKRLIEIKQEIFQLQDKLRISREDVASTATDKPTSLRSGNWSRSGSLPDFVVIGAQKCGTSTFYDLLNLHPHVKPAASKELHYFDAHFGDGIEWYRRCFPSPRWLKGHKTITGEATPAYMFWPYIPERMAEAVPDAKLIVLLRNPVERAYSHYHHQVRLSAENLDFQSAIEREAARPHTVEDEAPRERHRTDEPGQEGFSYLSRGIYADQLLRWLQYFDSEQILVIESESFFEDTAYTLKKAANFLDLPEWEPPSRKPRNKGQYAPMNPATRQWLTDYFEPHNQRLYELLNQDFRWQAT